VLAALATPMRASPLYPLEWNVRSKLAAIATRMYGAAELRLSEAASRQIEFLESHGFGKLPVCVAKTPSSLSHDANLRNRPEGFTFPVDGVRLFAGAGYVLCLSGSILTMPGLPRVAAAESIDIDHEGRIQGL
jgi:formate--tetrahydrofolate ligase